MDCEEIQEVYLLLVTEVHQVVNCVHPYEVVEGMDQLVES